MASIPSFEQAFLIAFHHNAKKLKISLDLLADFGIINKRVRLGI